MNFSAFDELKDYIYGDLKRKEPRGIRFIHVDSLDMWVQVKSWLADICTKSLKLSDFCGGDDLTPNINRMLGDLKRIRESTLLIPLSEYLRINNTQSDSYMSRLINLEFETDAGQSALFIPMYRMKAMLSKFIKRDPRFEKNVLFLETTVDGDYSLTIVPNNMNVSLDGYNIAGFKKYLSYWEENPDKPIVLYTSNVKYYKDNIFTDNVNVRFTAFDILRYHKNIGETVSESMGADWQWEEMLRRIDSDRTLNGVFTGLFNIPKYNAAYLLSKWNGYGSFEKWAIWLWSKLEVADGYLRMVLDTGCGPENFIEGIIGLIFEVDTKNNRYMELYRQRKEYLRNLSIVEPPPSFCDQISKIKPAERLFYLTDCTVTERCEAIRTIATEGFAEKFMDLLELADPALKAYIEPYAFESEPYTDYFAAYKRQKIADTVTGEFMNKVREYASSKGTWWGLCSRNKLIDDAYDKNTLIFWIDALGVEYLSLILFMLREQHRGVYCRAGIGYANIPTTTKLNKDFLQGRSSILFRDLDKAKHDSDPYPASIINEFELIERALRQAVEGLVQYEKVIITSDHGASRLAVLAHDKACVHKAKDGASVQRHGRYCIDKQNDYGSEIGGCVDKDEYHVFADYDRFSIQGGVTGEIHGGASLEEVLVPVIELSKRPFDAGLVITLLTPVIKLIAGQKAAVKFTISGDYDKLQAEVGGKRYDCIKDIGCWHFEPKVDRKTDYQARVVHKGKILGTLQFKIQKGITSNLDI
ncbi:MAG: BREX-4 system phosphatase PglZ [Nitrospirae bacterium]|nr:BREX-4 system phosphatase PglZ [Nitrospirota bacterium]